MEKEVKKLLQDLATKRSRPVLCFLEDLETEAVDYVRRNIAPLLKSSNELSVLLDSPGGYIEDTYRIILALRQYVDDIEVLVPHWAKSAATFFCLSANTIYMGQHGELGPLDPQRLDPRGGKRRISSLESFKALDQLLRYSFDSLLGTVNVLSNTLKMDIPHSLENSQSLFASIVQPLYSQVDPHELGNAGSSLANSEEYAKRVMKRWGYSDKKDEYIWQIARQLTWDYPTHGFVIDLFEAQQVGLNARELEPESDALCWQILDKVDKYIGVEFLPSQDGENEEDEEDVEDEQKGDNNEQHITDAKARNSDGVPNG